MMTENTMMFLMIFRSVGVTITDGEDVNTRSDAGPESRKERSNGQARQPDGPEKKKTDQENGGGKGHLPDRADRTLSSTSQTAVS